MLYFTVSWNYKQYKGKHTDSLGSFPSENQNCGLDVTYKMAPPMDLQTDAAYKHPDMHRVFIINKYTALEKET